jgi:hypothetical protein
MVVNGYANSRDRLIAASAFAAAVGLYKLTRMYAITRPALREVYADTEFIGLTAVRRRLPSWAAATPEILIRTV